MFKLATILITACTLLNACSYLSNKNQSVAVECRISVKEAENSHFIKLLNQNSSELTATDLASLRAIIVKNGFTTELKPTNGGCISVAADEEATIQAFSLKDQLSVSVTQKFGPANAMTKINLLSLPNLSVTQKCPKEGLFANDALEQFYLVKADGPLANVDLGILAKSQSTGEEYSVFEKPFGDDDLSLPQKIDLSELPEDIYSLKFVGKDLIGSWSKAATRLSSEDCPVAIIRNNPQLSLAGDNSRPFFLVSRLGDKIPWENNSTEDSLYVCHEGRPTGPFASEKSQDRCAPSNHCQTDESFQQPSNESFHDIGIQNYFYYLKDRAGNKSELACRTVVVVDKSPHLEVKWANEEWNRNGDAVMYTPTALLEANIEVDSDLLERSYLEEHLSCKVDFGLKGTTILKGTDVVCLSDSCKGQSMGDFVPCDKKIRFSITNAWKQKSISRSLLRLTVKSEDGSGISTSKIQSLWINDSTWSLKEVNIANFALYGGTMLKDKFEHLFVQLKDFNYAYWKDDSFHKVSNPATTNLEASRIVQDKTGEIYGLWFPQSGSNSTSSELTYILGRWTGESWDLLDDSSKSGHNLKCSDLVAHSRQGFWCINSELESNSSIERVTYSLFKDGKWTYTNSFTNPANTCDERFVFTNRDDQSLFLCKNELRILDNSGNWSVEPIVRLEGAEKSRLFSTKSGSVWLLGATKSGDLFLGQIKGKRFDAVPLPMVGFPSTYEALSMSEDPAGNLASGSLSFHEDRNSWELIEEIQNLFPGRTDLNILTDRGGEKWINSDTGVISLIPGQNEFIPLNFHGVRCDRLVVGCQILRDKENNIWIFATSDNSFDYKFYRFKPKKYVYFNGEMTGLPSDDTGIYISIGDQSINFVSIGTSSKGVKFQDAFFQKSLPNIPPTYDLGFDGRGRLYAGTEGGVKRITENDIQLFSIEPTKKSSSDYGKRLSKYITDSSGGVWFIWSNPGRLIYIKDSTVRSFEIPGLHEARLIGQAIVKDKLFIADKDGFIVFNMKTENFDFLPYSTFKIELSSAINYGPLTTLKDGRLAFTPNLVDYSNRIFLIDVEKFETEIVSPYLNNDGSNSASVNSLFLTKTGRILAATWEGLYARQDQKWLPVVTTEMLSEDGIEGGFYDFGEDKFGSIWMTTNLGIIRKDNP